MTQHTTTSLPTSSPSALEGERLAAQKHRESGAGKWSNVGTKSSRHLDHFSKAFRRLKYYLLVPKTWLQLTVHNTWGILNVLDIIWLRPMRGGIIDESHPFCTGIDPATGAAIWNSNLIFASPRRDPWPQGALAPDPDHEIIEKLGRHLCKQVQMAAATAEFPTGRPSPMPPGILYLHGGVHYNGGWLLFNDFADAIHHFTDRRFVAEFRRFVKEQKREPVTVFRDR